MSEWRKNKRTGRPFPLPLPTQGTRRMSVGKKEMDLPNETVMFMRKARAVGLQPRIEMWDIDKLQPRGLRVCDHPCKLCEANAHDGMCELCGKPFESEQESNVRFKFIVDHLDRMPYPVVYAHNGDVADGNHRVGIYKAKGYTRIPVLAIYGAAKYRGDPDDPVGRFEEEIQRYNGTAGFAGREFGTL